jgi:deazaflavin-dependent oxidoreductase (nitroreductase family)
MKQLARVGLAPAKTYLLSVRGRRSGRIRTTPVNVVDYEGDRWLVAPYGKVDWVRNIRAAGEAALRRGRNTEIITVQEVDGDAALPVLKRYAERTPITRSFFSAEPGDPAEAFRVDAEVKPVFRITSSSQVRRRM